MRRGYIGFFASDVFSRCYPRLGSATSCWLCGASGGCRHKPRWLRGLGVAWPLDSNQALPWLWAPLIFAAGLVAALPIFVSGLAAAPPCGTLSITRLRLAGATYLLLGFAAAGPLVRSCWAWWVRPKRFGTGRFLRPPIPVPTVPVLTKKCFLLADPPKSNKNPKTNAKSKNSIPLPSKIKE